MTVFHTSNTVVSAPAVLHSRPYLDFGPGFYVTPVKMQAVNYAQRFTKWGDDAYLNTYEMAAPDMRRLVAVRPNRQICFLTQAAIDTCLTYLRTDKLK